MDNIVCSLATPVLPMVRHVAMIATCSISARALLTWSPGDTIGCKEWQVQTVSGRSLFMRSCVNEQAGFGIWCGLQPAIPAAARRDASIFSLYTKRPIT
jgi:hypothetical protein